MSLQMHQLIARYRQVAIPNRRGYLENTDNISGKHGQHGHGQHAKSNPNCNPKPNPDYYFT